MLRRGTCAIGSEPSSHSTQPISAVLDTRSLSRRAMILHKMISLFDYLRFSKLFSFIVSLKIVRSLSDFLILL